MRLAVLALVALSAMPAVAQTDAPSAAELADFTPEAILAQTWTEALGGATATSWALDAAVYEDSTGAALPEAERLANVRRELMTAVEAGAATSGGLAAALQFSVALADPADRAEVYAALSDDTVVLHQLLVQIAEEAGGFILADPDVDVEAARATWRPQAALVRTLVGRLEGATAALGLVDEGTTVEITE